MSARKMRTVIIVMVILLVAAVAGYIGVDRYKKAQEDAEAQAQAELTLFSFSDDAVTDVDLKNEDGHFHITKGADGWEITDTDYPNEIRLNPYYINSVTAAMCVLTADKKIEAADDRMADYGFDDPAVVTCTVGGVDKTIEIGNFSATGESCYIRRPDSSDVFAITYDKGMLFSGGVFYLMAHDMIRFTDVEMDGYTLERDGKTVYDLDRSTGMWTLEAPKLGASVDSAQVSSMLTMVTRIEYQYFYGYDDDPEALKASGFTKAAYRVTASSNGETVELEFGPIPEGKGLVPVHDLTSGLVCAIDSSSAGFLNSTLNELLTTKMLPIGFSDAASMEATIDDTSFTMTMDPEAGEYRFNDTPIDTDDTALFRQFRELFETVPNMTYEEVVLDPALPETPEATCRFHITTLEGTEYLLELVPTDEENLYWAYVDGTYEGFTVRRRALTGSTGVLPFYEKMVDMLS